MPQTSDKRECLEHYAEIEPQRFWQFDGFNPPTYPAGLDSGDSDDDEIWGSWTWELMRSRPEVRLLIPDDADAEIVLRMLEKIAAAIRRKGLDWSLAHVETAEGGVK